MSAWKFLREFVKSPSSIGALCPSSPALSRAMCEAAQVDEARSILEIGAGTGSFTTEIIRCRKSGAQFIAIERNPALVATLNAKFPNEKIIEHCATRLGALYENSKSPDAIVSGLPWAAFDDSLQLAILDEIKKISSPQTVFVTFAYYGPHCLPKGRAFRQKLDDFFSTVETLPVVWHNLPPAFVYRCQS